MRVKSAIILAAGAGTRMKSNSSKPMTKVCGKPLIQYGIDNLLYCGINDICIVYSNFSEDVLELRTSYPEIHFIKQEKVDGSLSTFIFISQIRKEPFFMLDCDIIFSKEDFEHMINSVSNSLNSNYFAVVLNSVQECPKYILIEKNQIVEFNKKGVPNGYAGGMIYMWNSFPNAKAQKYYMESKSLGSFFNKLVKEENIYPMYINSLFDIDTMEDVTKAEYYLKNKHSK